MVLDCQRGRWCYRIHNRKQHHKCNDDSVVTINSFPPSYFMFMKCFQPIVAINMPALAYWTYCICCVQLHIRRWRTHLYVCSMQHRTLSSFSLLTAIWNRMESIYQEGRAILLSIDQSIPYRRLKNPLSSVSAFDYAQYLVWSSCIYQSR